MIFVKHWLDRLHYGDEGIGNDPSSPIFFLKNGLCYIVYTYPLAHMRGGFVVCLNNQSTMQERMR